MLRGSLKSLYRLLGVHRLENPCQKLEPMWFCSYREQQLIAQVSFTVQPHCAYPALVNRERRSTHRACILDTRYSTNVTPFKRDLTKHSTWPNLHYLPPNASPTNSLHLPESRPEANLCASGMTSNLYSATAPNSCAFDFIYFFLATSANARCGGAQMKIN